MKSGVNVSKMKTPRAAERSLRLESTVDTGRQRSAKEGGARSLTAMYASRQNWMHFGTGSQCRRSPNDMLDAVTASSTSFGTIYIGCQFHFAVIVSNAENESRSEVPDDSLQSVELVMSREQPVRRQQQ